MTIDIRGDLGQGIAVFMALVVFGIFYDQAVAWANRHHYTESFLSLIVAFSVFITLLGTAIINLQAAVVTLVFFVASGLPMIIGSIIRYTRARAAHIEALKRGEYDF